MTSITALLLAADAARVGVGKIQGGWEYVVACYVISWLGSVLYALSLWTRRQKGMNRS